MAGGKVLKRARKSSKTRPEKARSLMYSRSNLKVILMVNVLNARLGGEIVKCVAYCFLFN